MNPRRKDVVLDCGPKQTDARIKQSTQLLLNYGRRKRLLSGINICQGVSWIMFDECLYSQYIVYLPAIACADPVTVCMLLPNSDCRQHDATVRNIVMVMIVNPVAMNILENFHGNG